MPMEAGLIAVIVPFLSLYLMLLTAHLNKHCLLTTMTPINLVVATLRERKAQGQELKPPLICIPLGSNLKDIEIAERKKTMGGVMKA